MNRTFLKILRKTNIFLKKTQRALEKYIRKYTLREKIVDEGKEHDAAPPVKIQEDIKSEIVIEPSFEAAVEPSELTVEEEAEEIDYSSYLFGIDLGTSTTKISCNREAGHNTIEIGKSENLRTQMPSLVCFLEDGVRVGEDIVFFQESLESKHIKLKLGQISDLPESEIEKISAIFCEIFKEVVRRIKRINEFRLLNCAKMRLNISTSSYFNLQARKLLLDSAKKAGFANLTLDNIVEEPVAAGLSYIETCGTVKEPLYVLVCDYGAGTFDGSLIRVFTKEDGTKRVDVLATAGVLNCGGAAIDEKLSKQLTATFQLEDILEDPYNRLRFTSEVEEIKKRLSLEEEISINLAEINDGEDKIMHCTRDILEKIIDDCRIKDRSLEAIDWIIRVGMKARERRVHDYDVFTPDLSSIIPKNIKILFVGGTSKIPYIRNSILRSLGLDEDKIITQNDFPWDPVEAVAIGDSYSRVFEGINLNRPAFNIFIEMQEKIIRVQESYEGFLIYDNKTVNKVFNSMAIKRERFKFSGRIKCKIYVRDQFDAPRKFAKEHGASFDLLEEDVFTLIERNCSLEVTRKLNGEILISVEPYVGVSRLIGRYISPWRIDEDLSDLSTWSEPQNHYTGAHGDDSPG